MAIVGSIRNPAATNSTNMTVPSTEEEDEFDANGARIMTPRVLHRLCRARGHYLTPACNTSLYLQDMRFRRVENLQAREEFRVIVELNKRAPGHVKFKPGTPRTSRTMPLCHCGPVLLLPLTSAHLSPAAPATALTWCWWC